MFLIFENNKSKAGINRYSCGFCKKSFRTEKHLDKHFDNRHSDKSSSVSFFKKNKEFN